MKKHFMVIVLLLTMAALVPLAAQSPEADFATEPNGGGVVITEYKGKGGNVVIPAAIGGKAVVGIGDNAFNSNESLVSVMIPAGVTTIGEEAFSWCKSLTSVTIPDSVTTIGEGAFASCRSLKAISVAAVNRQYKDIDGVLFTKDGKTLVTYPAGGKTDYTVPAGVTTIGTGAFKRCESLTSVTIPKGVISIGEDAFSVCESLTSVTIPEGVTTIGGYAFSGSGLTFVTIPVSVASMGDYAFAACRRLKPEVAADIKKRFGEGPLTSPW